MQLSLYEQICIPWGLSSSSELLFFFSPKTTCQQIRGFAPRLGPRLGKLRITRFRVNQFFLRNLQSLLRRPDTAIMADLDRFVLPEWEQKFSSS